VTYDGCKDKSLDLNATIEKPIALLAIDGKEVGNSPLNIIAAKFEQKKIGVPKIKKELTLSIIEIKPRCSLGLPKWQEKKLQKLSVEKLKEKGLAWVPKRSV
jgi:hypothetical protein